jgi:beta-lactamase class D
MSPNAIRAVSLLCLTLLASACAGCSTGQPAENNSFVERKDFGRYFRGKGVTGTLLIYDVRADRFSVHDAARARKKFIPASTFKIPHSLIALETGIIADTSTVLRWDGRERNVAAWNRDHSMTTAFRHSVVWYYQETARRIGDERMRHFLHRMDYGNADIGGGLDLFWLTGDLRISAAGQIDLLRRLYRSDLPFSEKTINKIKGIMVEERGRTERGERYVLRAKTGWAQEIGWYAGYVETGGHPLFFALNMDMPSVEQAPMRKRIVRAALSDLGLI